jgi:uncharacterized protein (DUF885 family)
MKRIALFCLLLLLTTGIDVQSLFAADTSNKELRDLVESYFEETLKLNPLMATEIGDLRYNDQFPNSIGPEHRKKEEQLEREYLKKIQAFDSSGLNPQDQITYDSFKTDREQEVKGFQFPRHLMPINQSFSVPNYFVVLGSGAGSIPFKTVKHYEDFLKRIDGFVVWMDQAIVNMKEGVQKGYVQPGVLMEKVLPQLQAQVVARPEDSLFWGPVTKMPETLSEADRRRLTGLYREAITKKLIPAFKSLHDYIRDEYNKHTRETVGLDALPNGKALYAYAVKRYTTTNLTPEQIHQIGLDEVKRIHDEMRKVIKEVNFQGDLKAFFKYMNEDPKFYYTKREDLINGYRQLKDKVTPLLPKLFDVMPKADYEVRAVEPFREQSASGGSYDSAAPDGSRPGVFYVNAYDLTARPKWAMEALSLHEAAPGHHFQIAIQQEMEELPRFRRFGGYGAYIEGWGLYAESIGKELGVYTDPYQYFGALNAELWRAIRLVVDTGLHAKKWTREDVLNYMYENSAVKEARAVSETERYIAAPGQALSYKIGQLKIRELRDRAEKELGAKFDVKEFHNQVLLTGAVPLDVLERKIDRWIASTK